MQPMAQEEIKIIPVLALRNRAVSQHDDEL